MYNENNDNLLVIKSFTGQWTAVRSQLLAVRRRSEAVSLRSTNAGLLLAGLSAVAGERAQTAAALWRVSRAVGTTSLQAGKTRRSDYQDVG